MCKQQINKQIERGPLCPPNRRMERQAESFKSFLVLAPTKDAEGLPTAAIKSQQAGHKLLNRIHSEIAR